MTRAERIAPLRVADQPNSRLTRSFALITLLLTSGGEAWADVIDGGAQETVIGTGGGTKGEEWQLLATPTPSWYPFVPALNLPPDIVPLSNVIGETGKGQLTISHGGQAIAQRQSPPSPGGPLFLFLGMSPGAEGRIVVTDPGSLLRNVGTTFVGGAGIGSLEVSNGATARSAGLRVGDIATGTGSVAVAGSGSTLSSTSLRIGNQGTGSVSVASGGVLNVLPSSAPIAPYATDSASGHRYEINTAVVGDAALASGQLAVAGPGSIARIDKGIYFGRNGSAVVSASAGAQLQTRDAAIGYDAGSNGSVTVTGSGSRWIIHQREQSEMVSAPFGPPDESVSPSVPWLPTYPGFDTSDAVQGLWIGRWGEGSLTIADGADVTLAPPSSFPRPTGFSSAPHETPIYTEYPERIPAAGGLGAIGIVGVGSESYWGDGGGNPDSKGWLNIGGAEGSAAAAPGKLTAAEVVLASTGTLVLNHNSSNYIFAPTITGGGTIRVLSGNTTLAAVDGFAGRTELSGGSLRASTLNGALQNEASLRVGALNLTDGASSNSGFTRLDGQFANDAEFVNSGVLSGFGSIVNRGSFNIAQEGLVTVVGGYTQESGATVVDGVLATSRIDVNGGTLQGSGLILGNVDVFINEGGTLAPGQSPGTLEIDGNLYLNGGVLDIEIDSLEPGHFDQVMVSGIADLSGGTIAFHILDAAWFQSELSSESGMSFSFLQAAGGIAGLDSAVLAFYSIGMEIPMYTVALSGQSLIFEATDAPAVPLPAAAWLLLSGLGGLGALSAHRRRALHR